MKRVLVRILGILLILAGVAGLGFSIFGLVALGQVKQSVETNLMQQLELVDRALVATGDGLAVAEASLGEAVSTIKSLEGTVASVEVAIEGTAPTLDAVGVVLGDHLPATIEATQRALSSLGSTAKLVDDFLLALTSFPLLSLGAYNPEVPMHTAVDNVASSLETIPTSLREAEAGLAAAGSSLDTLQGNLGAMTAGVGQIADNLEDSRAVVSEYQGIVSDVQGLIRNVRTGLPQWLQWLRIGLSLLLIWLGIAQVGLITQGWELVARSGKAPREDVPAGETSTQEGEGEG